MYRKAWRLKHPKEPSTYRKVQQKQKMPSQS